MMFQSPLRCYRSGAEKHIELRGGGTLLPATASNFSIPRGAIQLYPQQCDRRAAIRAELDARYAGRFGLDERDLTHRLEPTDVYGPDFPGETFRVLKDQDNAGYGEYRTRRQVLETWDRLHQQGDLR